MQLLGKLFNTKKVELDESDLFWQRDEDEFNGNNSKINSIRQNPNELNYNDKKKMTQTSNDDEKGAHSYQNKISTSIVNPWNGNQNLKQEIKSPYVDINPVSLEKPYQTRKRMNQTFYPQILNSDNEAVILSNDEFTREKNLNSESRVVNNSHQIQFNSIDKVNKNGNYNYRAYKGSDFNPKLKDFYELENRIERKMKEEEDIQREKKLNTKIFDEKVSNQFMALNHGKQQISQFPVKTLTSSLPRTDEINARREYHPKKVTVFELEDLSKGNFKKIESNFETKNKSFFKNQNDGLEDILDNQKSIDELIDQHKQLQEKLFGREEVYFRLVSDPNNLTVLEADSKTLKQRIEKNEQNIRNIQTQIRNLNEEITGKASNLNRLITEIQLISKSAGTTGGVKENILKEIQIYQEKKKNEEIMLESHQTMNEEKIKKWKDLSEKAMNQELDAVKTRVLTFNEDLISELKYFGEKFKIQK